MKQRDSALIADAYEWLDAEARLDLMEEQARRALRNPNIRTAKIARVLPDQPIAAEERLRALGLAGAAELPKELGINILSEGRT